MCHLRIDGHRVEDGGLIGVQHHAYHRSARCGHRSGRPATPLANRSEYGDIVSIDQRCNLIGYAIRALRIDYAAHDGSYRHFQESRRLSVRATFHCYLHQRSALFGR